MIKIGAFKGYEKTCKSSSAVRNPFYLNHKNFLLRLKKNHQKNRQIKSEWCRSKYEFSLKMTENTIFKQVLNQDQRFIKEIRHSLWVEDPG